MIRYTLTCGKGHGFDSWFPSAETFDRLKGAGQLACAVCGDAEVTKALMAPAVRPARKAAAAGGEKATAAGGGAGPGAGPGAGDAARPDLRAPASELEEAMAELRRRIEANSDYVGLNFVAEARAMHEGRAPERSIYGEAKPEEARALLEDGVPVAPLPFLPARKTN